MHFLRQKGIFTYETQNLYFPDGRDGRSRGAVHDRLLLQGSTAASTRQLPQRCNKLDSIQKSGKLVVALEGAWQPWSYHDSSDTLVGYDVEVSRAIAEKLGVEPEYVESDWDSLFAGLDAGRYDMVCNGVEVTEERAKTYDFHHPLRLHPHCAGRAQGQRGHHTALRT